MAKIRYRGIADRLSWSPQQQARYGEARLRAVLERAFSSVPFYEKRLHQHGLTLRELRHLKNLTVVPLISLADLEREHDAFLVRDTQPSACVSRCRAGTSDRTMRVYLSPDECRMLRAIERRTIESSGLTGRYTSLMVVPPNQIPPPPGWCEQLLHGRRYYVSSFETTPEHLRVLRQTRPDCVAAPLWVLTRLVKEIQRSQPLGFAPRLVLSWGECMRDADREALRETFRVVPTDLYQAWEFGPLAAECPLHDGLHVNFDLAYIEILSQGRTIETDEIGEVVLTSLVNHTMPLIRYRLGDLANWKKVPCACGWKGPVLAGVHGRLEQAILLPTGGHIGVRQLEKCLDQFTNILAYRAIQTDRRMVELLIVPSTLFQERTAQLLRQKCLELFNNEVGVELRTVNELPILTGNRRQPILCKLPRV